MLGLGNKVIAALEEMFTLYKLPRLLASYIGKFLILLKYKINVYGQENIEQDKGILLLGNHISYIDWIILQISSPNPICFVMEKTIYCKWYNKWLLYIFDVIPISAGDSKLVAEALNKGHTVALFPEGELSKTGAINNFVQSHETLAREAADFVIIPFYLHGLWGSRFSLANRKTYNKNIKVGVFYGEPLAKTTSSAKVRDRVIDLSVIAWKQSALAAPCISRYWLINIKTSKTFFTADSIGVNLNARRFLTATLIARKWFTSQLNEEQNNIGVILPSSVACSITNMALFCLGKTVVNLNYTTGIPQLQASIAKSKIKTIITSGKFLEKLKEKKINVESALTGIEIIYLENLRSYAGKLIALKHFLATFLPARLLIYLFGKRQDINDTAVILFSSGSEGTAKGVVLSHANIIANVMQAKYMLNPDDTDILTCVLPAFHSFGLTVCTLLPQLENISAIYHPDPTDGFSIGKLIEKHKGTILLGTATFLRLYVNNKKCRKSMFASVEKVIVGAEKLTDTVRQSFYKKFAIEIYEGYGTTETSPVASCNLLDKSNHAKASTQIGNKHGTIGRPIIGTKIIIVDPDSYRELAVGEEGMIMINGPQVMQSYLQDEKKTLQAIKYIDENKYYVTGDKGSIDSDGFVTIVDRYSRIANIGGEMISLSAVESEIQKNITEEIELCAINIPDARKGEKIVLLYLGKQSPAELRKCLMHTKINPLFVPKHFFSVTELPKLGSGKIDFNAARKLLGTHSNKLI